MQKTVEVWDGEKFVPYKELVNRPVQEHRKAYRLAYKQMLLEEREKILLRKGDKAEKLQFLKQGFFKLMIECRHLEIRTRVNVRRELEEKARKKLWKTIRKLLELDEEKAKQLLRLYQDELKRWM